MRKVQPRHMQRTASGWYTNKWILLALIIGIIFIVVPSSLFLISKVDQKAVVKQKKVATAHLVHELEQTRFNNQAVSKKETVHPTSQPTQVMVVDKNLPKDIQTSLTQKLQKIETTWRSSSDELLLSYIHIKPTFKNIEQVEAGITSYEWNNRNKAYEQKKQEKLPLSYRQVTDNQLITSQLFLKSEENLAAVHLATKQILLDKLKPKSEVVDAILTLPAFTWDTPIAYHPDHLVVTVPASGKLTEQTVDVPYQKIKCVLNPDYVDDKLLATTTANQDSSTKKIALTFDDGPNPTTTPKILATLKEQQIHATFFQLGKNVAAHPELAKQVHDEGHEIGSHTYNHVQLNKADEQTIQKEIVETDRAIYQAMGLLPQFIRPPYGAVNATVAKLAGRPIIQWDVDSRDWATKNAAKTLAQIQQTVSPNGIILLHDIQPSTAAVLPQLIDWLKAQGYEFVTIDQLLHSQEKPFHQYFSQTDERTVS